MSKHPKLHKFSSRNAHKRGFGAFKLFLLFCLMACYFLTLAFILSGATLLAIVLFLLHSVGFLLFYCVDTAKAVDPYLWYGAEEYDPLPPPVDVPAPYAFSGSSAAFGDSSASQVSDAAVQESLLALQEKCRSQENVIHSLEEELAQYSEKSLCTKTLADEFEKRLTVESLLPDLSGSDLCEPVNLIAVAQQVVDELATYSMKAGIQVQISSSEDAILMKANPDRIRIMFRNIVDNSIKYMQRAGGLTVTISSIGDDIFIVLKDNGNGLPEPETEHVFELNYQGSNRISGNGLGLTQAKAIVNSYGGTIYAKSAEGRGMGVYIQLPVNQGGQLS